MQPRHLVPPLRDTLGAAPPERRCTARTSAAMRDVFTSGREPGA